MTRAYDRQIAAELREIAVIWERDRGLVTHVGMFDNGICHALAYIRGQHSGLERTHTYNELEKVLKRATGGPEYDNYLRPEFYGFDRDDWSIRATFCLVLAHWLEGKR